MTTQPAPGQWHNQHHYDDNMTNMETKQTQYKDIYNVTSTGTITQPAQEQRQHDQHGDNNTASTEVMTTQPARDQQQHNQHGDNNSKTSTG